MKRVGKAVSHYPLYLSQKLGQLRWRKTPSCGRRRIKCASDFTVDPSTRSTEEADKLPQPQAPGRLPWTQAHNPLELQLLQTQAPRLLHLPANSHGPRLLTGHSTRPSPKDLNFRPAPADQDSWPSPEVGWPPQPQTPGRLLKTQASSMPWHWTSSHRPNL